MILEPIHTRIFNTGEDILTYIDEYLFSFSEGDILVITSKIVALAENRVATNNELVDLLLHTSDTQVHTPWATLTQHGDEWRINAGIDESNANDTLILLPHDSFASAKMIALYLKKKYSLKHLGVLITDTRSTPLRIGTIGRAIGFYGIKPLKNYIGKMDLYGRKSRVTQSNHIDALAGAAVLLMGEGAEQIPMVHIKNAPVRFIARAPSVIEQNLSISPKNDIFSYVFAATKSHQQSPKHPPHHQK